MKFFKKTAVLFLKQLDLGSAIAVRLTKITGKSKQTIHPKHFLTSKPWYLSYVRSTDVVLDLGCGSGLGTIKTARVAKKVIGVDLDDNLLQIAKSLAKNSSTKSIEFEKANLEKKLKFKTNSLDKVIFLDVLEHLNNRSQILKEIKRVLKPGGLVFIGVPNSKTTWKKLQREVGLNSFSDPDHKIEFSENQIRNLLKKHRFKVENFGYGVFDTPLRGVFDIIGGFSLSTYKKLSIWRKDKAKHSPSEASGFEIVCANYK